MSRFPLQSAVAATAQDPTLYALQPNSSVDHTHDDKDSIDKDAEAQGSNEAETPITVHQDDGVTRIEALCRCLGRGQLSRSQRLIVDTLTPDVVFGKSWGLYILWISIGLIAYVYSLSRSTTAYCK
jgi:hypothetical protein